MLTSLLFLVAGCGEKPSTSAAPSEKPSVSEIQPAVTNRPSEKPSSGESGPNHSDSPSPSVDQSVYYTVSFDLNGGTISDPELVKPQKVKEGKWAKKPLLDPEKDHCTFLGWYDSLDDTKFSFNSGIYGNVNLIAKWQVNEEEKITLTFNPGNGEKTFTRDTFIGDYLNVPNPKKDGRVFLGWFVNGEYDKKWDGHVTSDLAGKTLYALYEKQSFNFKYEVNTDSSVTITGIMDINAAIVEIPESINGHPVTAISEDAFQNRVNITEISIPKTVTTISPKAFLGTTKLQSIKVDSANSAYKNDSDGILFTKDGTTLVYCPQKALTIKNQTVYTCPNALTKIGDYAFYSQRDIGLSSIIFNDGLLEIGERSFYECYARNNISFPDSLKKIGKAAFARTTATTTQFTVAWNEGLEEIDEDAFIGCYFKGTLTLPDSLKKIGDYAFTSLEDTPCAITAVNLPASLEYFGNAAFFYGYGIKTITLSDSNPNFKVVNNRLLSKDGKKLYWVPSDTAAKIGSGNAIDVPNGVEELRPHSLSDARFITYVTFPSSLKIIGDDAFHYNLNITAIDIPDSVTVIGKEAFRMREKLSSITFGKGVKEIGEAAFYECPKLTEIEFPSAIKKIGKEALFGCSSLTSVTFSEGLEEIGESAFKGDTGLTSLVFPNSLTTLGNGAFSGASGVKSITFGTGLTNFGLNVFGGDSSSRPKPTERKVSGEGGPKIINQTLISKDGKTVFYCSPAFTGKIAVPQGVTMISAYAYAYVKATGLDLGTSVESIGEGAFQSAFDYSSKVSLNLPSSLKTIENGAFHFSNITGVTFNEGLTTIGEGAFTRTSLGAVNFPSTLKTIQQQAFFSAGITSLTLNEGLEDIGEEAFLGNITLKGEITIPSTVKNIGAGAFTGRYNSFENGITGFKVAAANNYFIAEDDGVLYNKEKTILKAYPSASTSASLVLPSTVKTIDKYALAGAKNLTAITLNQGLETIGEQAFAYSTKVASLAIPSSVTSIGYRAFCNWQSSQKISFPWDENTVNMNFGNDWKNSCKAIVSYATK